IGDLYLQTKTDALGVGANVLRITRTGTTVDLIRVVATTVDVVGTLTATTAQLSKSAGGEILALNDSGAASAADANAWLVLEYNGTEMGRLGHLSTSSAILTLKNSLNSTVRLTANTANYDFQSNNIVNLGTAAVSMGTLTATTVDTTGRLAVVAAADSSFTGGGSVGVGTAFPQRDLHIEGGVPTIRLSDSNAATDQAVATLIELYRGNLTNRVGFWGMESSGNNVMKLATDYAAGEIALSTGSNVEALRLDSNQAATFSSSVSMGALTATTGTFSGAVGGITTLTATTLAGTLSTAAQTNVTSLGTLANLTVTNPITGSVSGSSGSTTGNASTATLLQNARTINGVSFNGGSNITVTADANTLTNTTLKSTVVTSSLTSVGTLSSLDMGGNIDLNTNNIIAGGAAAFTTITASAALIRGAVDQVLIVSGGNTSTLGGNIAMFGESHASKAKDIEFRDAANIRMKWDQSESEFTVFGQMIMDDGGLATDVAGVVVSASEPVAEDYVDGTIWCKI
ncbi:hypothetical protein LCGC14_1966070, partial [marine sediment metagenome]